MLSERFQIALSTSDDWEVCQELAEMRNLYWEAEENLANNEDPDVLETLANNPTISTDTQEILAQNINLNEDGLVALINHSKVTEEVLSYIAERSDLSSFDDDLQMSLAKSEYESVRLALAQNPEICEEAQGYLYENEDSDSEVLDALMDNPSFDIDNFVDDEDEEDDDEYDDEEDEDDEYDDEEDEED